MTAIKGSDEKRGKKKEKGENDVKKGKKGKKRSFFLLKRRRTDRDLAGLTVRMGSRKAPLANGMSPLLVRACPEG